MKLRWVVTLCRGSLLLWLLVAANRDSAAAEGPEELRYERLPSGGNRVYTQVTVKAYDPSSGRVTILCKEGMANVSLEDFPEKDRARIRDGRKLDNPLTTGSPESVRDQLREPVTDMTEGARTSTDPGSIEGKIERDVKNRARGYFKFNYTPRGTFHRCEFSVESKPPVELAGWPGRYRVRGDVTYTLFSNRKVPGGHEIVGIEIVGWEADVVVRDGKIEILDFKNE